MELTLVRDVCGTECTLGKLFVDGEFGYTVEDVVRPDGTKVPGKTAIPEGRYRLVLSRWPRFGRELPLLEKVPNFEGVRIHPGNTAEDTEGCIVPGRVRTARGVAESRLAFNELFAALKAELARGRDIWLSITTSDGAKLAAADARGGVRAVNRAGLELIKSFEGILDGDPTTVNIDPYLDPIGIWTIGWGHAISVGGKFLRGKENRKAARDLYPGGITLEQAEQLLRGDLLDTCRDVAALVKAPLTDQFAALVSFGFNVGCGNLGKSRLLSKLNGKDYAGAAAEFARWSKAGGKVLAGLTRRRAAEAALFNPPRTISGGTSPGLKADITVVRRRHDDRTPAFCLTTRRTFRWSGLARRSTLFKPRSARETKTQPVRAHHGLRIEEAHLCGETRRHAATRGPDIEPSSQHATEQVLWACASRASVIHLWHFFRLGIVGEPAVRLLCALLAHCNVAVETSS